LLTDRLPTTANAEHAEAAIAEPAEHAEIFRTKIFSLRSLRSPSRTVEGAAIPGWRATLIVVIMIAAGGCRQDMHDQPRFDPMREAPFFSDARSARPLVEGTVARGHLRED
jgi:hypothetical protein